MIFLHGEYDKFTNYEAFVLTCFFFREEIVVTSILAFLVSGGGDMCTVWSSYKTTKGKIHSQVITSTVFLNELKVLCIALLTGK